MNFKPPLQESSVFEGKKKLKKMQLTLGSERIHILKKKKTDIYIDKKKLQCSYVFGRASQYFAECKVLELRDVIKAIAL